MAPGRAVGLAATLALCLLAACLPLGPPPKGQRLVADGTASQVLFLPTPDGQPARILLQRIGDSTAATSLHIVDPPSTGDGLGTDRLLLDHLGSAEPLCSQSNCGPIADSRGRLFVERQLEDPSTVYPGSFDELFSVLRLDTTTGETTDFGDQSNLIGISSDHATVAYTMGIALALRDVDDHQVTVGDASLGSGQFLGDDLYFTTDDNVLWKLPPPYVAREMLAQRVSFYTVLGTKQVLLLLCRKSDPMANCQNALLDPVTAVETSLPPVTASGGDYLLSPSGRYLFGVGIPSDLPTSPPTSPPQLVLYDRETGIEETAVSDGAQFQGAFWRPGHEEVWFATLMYQPNTTGVDMLPPIAGFWRWQPGQTPIQVAAQSPFGLFSANTINTNFIDTSGAFTPDGRFWIAYPADPYAAGDRGSMTLNAVDDPTFEPLLLNPTGTSLEAVWSLADGRLIVEDRLQDYARADIYLADPAARTLRPLAQGGNVFATGATRILTLLNWLTGGNSGDLTLIDLATGAQTLLADNVHAVAIDGSSAVGGDRLAAGTRVAYVARNRIASPYDGLWLTTLP